VNDKGTPKNTYVWIILVHRAKKFALAFFSKLAGSPIH